MAVLPDRDGYVTLDACIMDENSNCGSVMCLEYIVHPISVAQDGYGKNASYRSGGRRCSCNLRWQTDSKKKICLHRKVKKSGKNGCRIPNMSL